MGFSIFGRKARAAARPSLPRCSSGGFWLRSAASPQAYEAMVRDCFIDNAVGQRSVRMVAEGVGALPLRVHPAGHPLAAILRRPAPNVAGPEIFENIAAYLALHGNAYVRLAEDAMGVPRELYVLRPELVKIECGADGWPAQYLYRTGNAVERFPAMDAHGRPGLLHLRAFHPLDDLMGMGGLEAAARAVATHNAASRWNAALLDNAARPSGALVYDPKDGSVLSPEQFERLKAEMEAGFAGADNAGRPMLLEGGLSWQPMSLTPAELDYVGSKAAAAREIALAFGVPPMLLGLPGDATYANYQEANRALWRLTLLPLGRRIVAGLEAWFRHWWPEIAILIEEDAIPALAAERDALWKRVGAADFLTIEEKRALLGVGAGAGAEEAAAAAARVAQAEVERAAALAAVEER